MIRTTARTGIRPRLLWYRTLMVVTSIFALLSCDDEVSPANFDHPIASEHTLFTGDGRIHFTISAYGTQDIINKIRWSRPNLEVGDEVITVGRASIDASGLLTPELGVTTAYVSGTTPRVTVIPMWRDDETPMELGTYHITGRLVQDESVPIPLFDVTGALEIESGAYVPITTDTTALLEATAKLYTLEIESTYSLPSGRWHTVTRTPFVTTLAPPLPDVPLYERVLRWGAMFLNGTFQSDGAEGDQVIAQRLFDGLSHVEALGHRYGPFPRPSDYDNSVEVFLDYPTVACGEMARFFMAMVETQGIEANVAVFSFFEPSETAPSMYETYPLAAMGTGVKVWRYQNHAVTQVNGVVYDPTYLASSPGIIAHEDFLFERFCYGEDRDCKNADDWCTIPSGPQGICVENAPGRVSGESPPVVYKEGY